MIPSAADRETLAHLREQTYPHPYPSGWYAVASASEIARGAVRGVTICGRRIVLFRTDDAKARAVALDGFCPHLGADLSGGCVEGDGVRCPFHRWRFDAAGQVTDIPYAQSRLKRSLRTGCWRTQEKFGLIFVWVGADDASHDPLYELPSIPEISSGELVFRGDRSGGCVAMHISEILENAADLQHFQFVHRDLMVPFTNRIIRPFTLEFDARLEFDRTHEHLAHLFVRSIVLFAGRKLEFSRGAAHVRFIGPGALLIFEISLPGLGRVVLLHTHTPIEPLRQEVRYRWYADRSMPRALVGYLAGAWISQVQSDYEIWANKIYRNRPLLVPEDGPMLEMRRWYRQFYPRDPRGEGRDWIVSGSLSE